ncbi:transporter substrate-binding domain-containing protein [Rouxiella badensis]|uniref:transporter substrate-binding domain-containing protein n=1 Tax=Rouxiella badensis TaxID=1646377 RepID=UPI001D15E0B5|nr:transporter substrate-binding domain-containing protein [Rouxiella badensis]MCC3721432.1 transporter substrate-binding domain-containing protein [Rouxiella badensis]MCC3730997.1 transporter substrate-binding domain-containing protein [Rouxiella badensis]MCC3742308.1 transporter substrate-binding domain-containing protein [Rouxiella badensis]
MKIKHFLSIATVLAAMATPFLATAADADGKLELLTPGKLSVATEGTDPPFSMRSANGQLDGLEIRVMKEVARRLHLEYVPVITKWDSILVGLQANQFDMSSAAMDITPARQKAIVFSDGWIESGGRIIIPPKSDIKSVKDLKGKRIGAQVSSTYAQLAIDHGATLKNYIDVTAAVQDLANGNIDGVINDSIGNAYLIKDMHLPLTQTPDYVSVIQKGFAFKKGKPNLVAAVNKALADMKADGTYAKLVTPIVGFDPAPKDPVRTLPQ